MNGLALALIISGVAIAIAVIIGTTMGKKLQASGEIIARKPNFVEMAEEFTLMTPDVNMVTEGIKNLNYSSIHASMTGNAANQTYEFKGGDWGAALRLKQNQGNIFVYRFSFTNWKTRNGMPMSAVSMNKLLTAVEKMFLSIDPNTQVASMPIEVDSKRSFW